MSIPRKICFLAILALPALFLFSVSHVAAVVDPAYDINDSSDKLEPEQAARLLDDKRYLFVDIREPAEFSAQYIPGFINIRVGDLISGEEYKKLDKTKKLVLICVVGERGSNVASFLRLKGYKAFYIEGGIKGWSEKQQKTVGGNNADLPDFPNKRKKVSRTEARKIVAAGKGVLVDIRLPEDFARGHIKGAVNIPLMNLPTSELEKSLKRLPKDKYVIGVAYDRFGRYYCKILGYLVHERKGKYGGVLQLNPQNLLL